MTPNRLTMLGLATGLGSAAVAATQLWWWALGLWLFSRAMDGLDGPLARRRKAHLPGTLEKSPKSEAGGFLDITADFVVYGATVVGVAIGVSARYGADWLPFLLVLLAYYINGTAFLAFSSIAERTGRQREDGRSFSFLGGLAEGTETIAVHSLWLVLPAHAELIAIVWATIVGLSATQRMTAGFRDLL
ncbi:CDP-alcohol phosphatidyltransferase family protein [Nocardioides rubriscoriae]|uniref:CDP-alcohol phosphatidyltransferase family protein n=1 Tax=Nocardioides rubriscoriae TaxID=642762 RepID=UPI001FE3201C|nr:CDP-alcohol phosphatidyltransferase family protein [Nocardioides rubriscoriae]